MRESILFRIASDPVGRVWSGVGDLVVPAGGPEAGSATYSGAGELVGVPDYQQLINGLAERIDIELSGVTAETQRLALEDKDSVEGAQVDIGRVEFNDDWSVKLVEWEARYRADKLSVGRTRDGRRTITLSIASDATNRSRAPMAFFTDADQRRISSTDAIFDQVALITSGTSRRFGPDQGGGKKK